MASLAQFRLFISIIFVFHDLQITHSKRVCDIMSCGDMENIQFPFGLKGSNQDRECSYYPNPSFQLTCNNQSQTILTLPNSGDLIVKSIDYEEQVIKVNDPDGCLPKRFLLKNFSLSGSPFKLNPAVYDEYFNLTFLSCPHNWTKSYRFMPSISCLSDDPKYNSNIGNTNSSSSSVIVAWWSRPIEQSPLSGACDVISSALVPIQTVDIGQWPFLWPDLTADIGLLWTEPMCWMCAISGQVCGFANDRKSLSQVGCFSGPRSKSQGIPRSAKYGLTIGVGVPGLLCLIGLFCFIFGKAKINIHRRRPITELPTISLQPIPLVMGLDGDTIEKYPKTLLGESGRLLKPSDNTCSICLSEYQPKETLRTVPECNHYFHADCIDEWLRLNGTCPLCRNTPGASSRVTPSFSSLSHTTSLSSTP